MIDEEVTPIISLIKVMSAVSLEYRRRNSFRGQGRFKNVLADINGFRMSKVFFYEMRMIKSMLFNAIFVTSIPLVYSNCKQKQLEQKKFSNGKHSIVY